jgi:hypothetical protein
VKDSGEILNGLEIVAYDGRDKKCNAFYMVMCTICNEVFRLREDKILTAKCCTVKEPLGNLYDQMKNIRKSMIDRCYRPERKDYANYGGRGIKIYEPWKLSLPKFIEDIENEIGKRPGPDYTLDRIDVNDDYRPGNVQWSNRRDQRKNRRLSET